MCEDDRVLVWEVVSKLMWWLNTEIFAQAEMSCEIIMKC
jgi:hypothetical protein